ncbi:pilus assembly protein [Marinobacterium lutimaris]|uniref:Type IV pilus assembly protein PilY1 n=1 Tax=Marinobacterium lutimaris TaxID=568106 RepID=A0A1H6CV06_9GAMM|nr:PilC/PilY family type IV pilus protein [Marinobacterium lutimaris]SEG76860.1 type IV pilus assembly protein PilY1 [Marinobacterium lutimaris]
MMKGLRIKSWLCSVSLLAACQGVNADVAQEPLFLGSSVPGNMAIVPSVEYPTVNSLANIDPYREASTFLGYFDPNKCYDYSGSANESERHFYPVSGNASNHRCDGAYWSGNFLNWASMQTIDPFRWALTGGYRVVDEPDETWIQKARNSGQNNNPDRTIYNDSDHSIRYATPFNASQIIVSAKNGHGLEFQVPANAEYLGDSLSSELLHSENFNGSISADLNYGFHTNDYSYGGSYGNRYLRKSNNSGGRNANDYIHNRFDIDDGVIFSGDFYLNSGSGNRDAAFFIGDNQGNGYGIYVYSGDTNGGSTVYIDILDGGNLVGPYVSSGWANVTRGEWHRFTLSFDGARALSLSIVDSDNNEIFSTSGNGDLNVGNISRIYFKGNADYGVDNFRIERFDPTEDSVFKYESLGNNRYRAAVRVKVCDPVAGLEANCQPYSQGWKPEGLMQQYAEQIRYSVFGYLNDNNVLRDGGVLRAQQKFIGARERLPGSGWQDNNQAEWDLVTGVMYPNPDSSDAQDTENYYGVNNVNSGAMNYINKFGELNNNTYKTSDPVSELYYTATRYFRNIGPVPEYTNRGQNYGNDTARRWVDNFAVIRDDWEDPIQYSCQKNVILGIGDVNTHRDQNLPGSSFTGPTPNVEPSLPSAVNDDTAVNVHDLNQKVGELESLTLTDQGFGATRNPGYMIGLAYDAHTRDQRDDIPGRQTIDTYWVDVLEYQVLNRRQDNQFWLTAKYGGFTPKCPDDEPNCSLPEIEGPDDLSEALPEHWWFTNGETLTQSNANLKRADNYFPAGQADAMVEGLERAFSDIAESLTSTATAVSFNSDQLVAGSLIFQAMFDTNRWSGDLVAYSIDTNGGVGSRAWSAAEKLDARNIGSRKVFTSGDFSNVTNGAVTGGRSFTSGIGLAPDLVNYVRGDRSNESVEGFRPRSSRLGDIVNSSPQYIDNEENFGYSALAGNSEFGDAGAAYASYREGNEYQNKPPVVVVGANDGMLHVFNGSDTSSGGNELFAYVPGSVLGGLDELANPGYVHRYYVDGTPRLGDAWLGSHWATLAVATTGAGSNSVFALDITDPNTMSSSDVLWEYTNEKMGFLVQQPSLVALGNGDFGVVVTSGYETDQDEGYVWILDASDGQVIREFELDTQGGELGAPLVIDLERDRIADRIYVGDTQGNLWRIDIDDTEAADWEVFGTGQQGSPLFVAMDADNTRQPITAPLSAAFNGNNDPMILFGTGSFHEQGDNIVSDDPQVQTLYGIFDEGSAVSGRGALQQQTITAEVDRGEVALRTTSTNVLTASDKGWFMDLYVSEANGGTGAVGERVVARASLTNDLVIFSTLIPSADPCAGGGSSWFLSLDYNSGSALNYQVFDVNNDGEFDAEDGIDGQVSSGFSDTDAGVSSGSITDQEDGRQVLVTTGSRNVDPETVNINDGNESGRIAWRELTQ